MHWIRCGTSVLAVVTLAAQAESVPPARWWSLPDSQTMQSLGLYSWGDLFDAGQWHSTLDISADGNMQTTRSPDDTETDFWSRLTSEGVTLRNQGFALVDPRLLTGDVSVRFALQQGEQKAAEVKSGHRGDVSDYYIGATLLGEKPYNATLLATQSETTTTLTGGGSTISRNNSQGATFNWREDSFLRDKELLPYFSALLQAREDRLREVTSSAGQSFHRDEKRSLVTLDGHNGFETADLYFRAEQAELDNLLVPQASYTSRYADVSYSLDFGPNLDRESNTHFNYSEREGGFSVSNLSFDQRLYLEHSDYLSSNYTYNFLRTESDVGPYTSHRVDTGLAYMPFMNVSTGFNLFGSRDNFATGTIATFGGYGDVSYNHDLPGGGNLMASLGTGMQLNDSELTSAQVPVIDAPYQAPPELGAGASFLLEEPYIVAASIVVVDVRGGARLPTVENVDYQVVVEGSRTRILPLASSAVIQPNDPLEVSYYYLVDPSLKSRTNSRSYFLSADWDWIAIAYTHDETQQTPLSGQQTTLLSDQDRDSLRVDLRGEWRAFAARADGTAARYRDTNLKYDELRFGQQVTYRPSYYWQVGLIASQSDTEFLETSRESQMRDIRFTAAWTTEHGLWADAFISHRTLHDSELPAETVTEGVVKVRRRWPKLDVAVSLGMGERTRGGVQTQYSDVHLTAVRQF